MVQLHARCEVALEARSVTDFIATQCLADLFRERLLVAEFGEEGFVEEVGDVLGIVVGRARGGGFRDSLLRSWLTRVDS
jgi:hypothetical protein